MAAILSEELRLHPDMLVVHGAAVRGADRMADDWCIANRVPTERHPADWSLGLGAGYTRNMEMVDLGADVCHAFFAGDSRGTKHCARAAKKAGIRVIKHRDAA